MESFLILKCLSSAAHTMSLMALDVPGMHLSMSIVHSTNVSLLRGAGGAVSARVGFTRAQRSPSPRRGLLDSCGWAAGRPWFARTQI
jgi:hypothetical protein